MPQRENNIAQADYQQVVQEFGRGYADVWSRLMTCGKCDRRMRPIKARVADWPETTTRAVSGACARCYSHGYGGPKPLRPLSDADRMKAPSVPAQSEAARSAETPRAQIARDWDEVQHAVAWTVCCYVHNPKEAAEVMDSLGLFDEDVNDYRYSSIQDPKGKAPENGNARKSHYS